jgi:hypothetical protein
MLVEVPSRSLMLNHVFIVDYNESFKTLYVEFKSNELICHAKFYVLYLIYWLMKWLVVLNICVLLVEGSVIILLNLLCVWD